MRQPTHEDPEDAKQRSRSGSRKKKTKECFKFEILIFQRMFHKNVLIVIVQMEQVLVKVRILILIDQVSSVN